MPVRPVLAKLLKVLVTTTTTAANVGSGLELRADKKQYLHRISIAIIINYCVLYNVCFCSTVLIKNIFIEIENVYFSCSNFCCTCTHCLLRKKPSFILKVIQLLQFVKHYTNTDPLQDFLVETVVFLSLISNKDQTHLCHMCTGS